MQTPDEFPLTPSASAPSVSTTRDDWIRAGLTLLVEAGVAAVKILALAERLGCSRSNFYWFFRDREALLDALLARWEGQNTRVIAEHAGLPVARAAEGVLNIFDCWTHPDLFDARLDSAVREWGRSVPKVAEALRRADEQRLTAIGAMFARCGADENLATVRARTLYFMQVGYYAIDLGETMEMRKRYLLNYVQVFAGELPTEAEMRAFLARLDAAWSAAGSRAAAGRAELPAD